MLCLNRAKPLSRHIEFSWYSKLSYDHRLINERDTRTLNNQFDEISPDFSAAATSKALNRDLNCKGPQTNMPQVPQKVGSIEYLISKNIQGVDTLNSTKLIVLREN